MTDYAFFATAPKNLESLLAEELRGLGIDNAVEGRGGARFGGPLAQGYRACLWSRVANRILLVLERFPAADPEALYRGVQSIDWSRHFSSTETIAVDFTTVQSVIAHSHFGAMKTKDAIVDQFRERTGIRPSVATQAPAIRINVFLHHDEATVSLDLSGESLHRRGYREAGAQAPLKENLAAALLLRAGWPEIAAGGGALLDPMCGSGTLPIEAALIAADIAPGLLRPHWGFLAWRGHQAGPWEALIADARERRARGLTGLPPIVGQDQDRKTLAIARANVARAGLAEVIHLERRALADAAPPARAPSGLVVINPPYGQRLGDAAALPALYTEIGRVLKQRFQGWRATIITDQPELGKRLALRARRMHSLYNGPLPCKLLHFEIAPEHFHAEQQGPRPLPADQRSDAAQMFANRLRKNQKRLQGWIRREDIRCYRLYDADLPDYAVAVDIYRNSDRWVHVQEYEAPREIDPHKTRRRLREALGVITDLLEVPADHVFLKIRRPQKGLSQYERLAATGHFHEVREGDLRFLVNFEDYLDTGLFLDHRPTRALLARLAGGKRFLNLYGYTGTATVYAARGGARGTTTVDLSRTYLEWARKNMALNGYGGPTHEFIPADCRQWLATQDGRRSYDLIFLDPPSFSSSKRMEGTLDIQRDHVDLIRKALALLAADGTLIFSNNLRRFRLDRDALSDLEIEDLVRQSLPPDFARDPHIHHCWRIRRPQL